MDLRYNQDTMLRSLPPLNLSGPSPSMAPTLERRAPSPLPPLSGPNDASRPSSTSTQSSNTLAFQHPTVSLPGLSTLAAVALPTNSQIRPPFNSINHQQHFTMTASPTPTSVSGQSNPPVCQNCATSTTPLWRRDELGSVLCNACGLFLKLHGRPRPISLKTDVIKSRNRVKSAQQKKKPMYFGNGLATARSEGGSPPPGFPRASHNSGSDHSHSPISRTTTPAMLGMPPHHMFDPSGMDHAFGPTTGRSPSLPALHFRQPSPNYLDRHLQPPHHPYESLQVAHTELKTRASELEVINGLFNDRIRQLEEEHRQTLEREHDYKRQIARLQDEVAFFRRSSTASKRSLEEDDDSPFAKRSRVSDVSTFSILSNPAEPLTTATKS